MKLLKQLASDAAHVAAFLLPITMFALALAALGYR